MHRNLAALLCLVVAVSTACSAGPAATNDPAGIGLAMADVARAPASSGDANAAAAAIDAFGLDLYQQLGKTGGNLVFSPASIALALTMARLGARGETAAQMDTVLHALVPTTAGDAAATAAAGLNALDQALAARSGTFPDESGKSQDVILRIANATFAQRDMAIQPAYLDALAASFGAGLRLVDYARDPDAARKLINAWVAVHTERRIPELLAPGTVDDLTRLALVNAIYLKAPWVTPFDPSLTKPDAFTRADGTTVQVPMMHGGGELPYAEGAGWQAVELPYVGGSLAMDVIVPDDLATF
ncbi:MAG: serpin family protein, partial [Candidatus Limnocylindrales bacterium]